MTDERRIYVADLAADNAGKLHGRWINATTDTAAMWAEVKAMLDASPEPGAEEFAIHDHEGVGRIGEFAAYLDKAAADGFDGFLALDVLDRASGDPDEAAHTLEAYCGAYESLADYAETIMTEAGEVDRVPDSLRSYIDWTAHGRDLELSGDVFTIRHGSVLYVFANR